MGEILFDKLNLNIPSNKKKSTSIEILTEIEYKHPIVTKIIRYRTITKLYSTYILGFEGLLDKNDNWILVANSRIVLKKYKLLFNDCDTKEESLNIYNTSINFMIIKEKKTFIKS